MRYRQRISIVLLIIVIYVGGCFPPFQSYQEEEKKLIYLREKKFYVGENERRQIDNIIAHPDAWFRFEPDEKNYTRTIYDNVQDAIEYRDRNIKGILDNEIKRVRAFDDNIVNVR